MGEYFIMRELHFLSASLGKFPHPGSLSRCTVTLGILCLSSSIASLGQIERPALIPAAQGGSPSASAASLSNIGGLSDEPFSPGQVVHVTVANAPDFSVITRVSESGDIAVPMLGTIHLEGLNSDKASESIAALLQDRDLVLDPQVTVTVDSASTGITILGEVRSPGIYPPPGKNMLSDLLATAGGLTANTGRVIQISNNRTPDQKEEIPWDPTMHNTSNYDRPVHPGDRVLVRACGIAYVGGHVTKPGAYSLCGSQQITLSELIALAGGISPLTADKHSYIVRTQPDGSKIAEEVDIHKILMARAADPVVMEDDIIYVTPSTIKDILNRASTWALSISNSLIYTVHQ